MTNLHKNYLAEHGFYITTPGLKTDNRYAALPTGEYACMYVYMCACSNVCVRACMRATDGMEGWRDGWI